MNTHITAKVVCTSKTLYSHQTTVKFTPDYADGRNKEWAAATPTLDFTLGLRPDVAERFELSAAYLVTFEKEDTH
ncbi:MAG TPA: hypothetical protein VFW65_31980 [Pseudonocardiaceae bacterium]|nr:hypothetical protein [Pseudonocardiaceae bacterium]